MSSTFFAPYEPGPEGGSPPRLPEGFGIETLTHANAIEIATIRAERSGVELEREEAWTQKAIGLMAESPDGYLVLLARVNGKPAAYACVWTITQPEEKDENAIPDGLYLGGVIVRDAWRRRGIGHALTEHRVNWALERVSELWYFANEKNLATIDLHARFGFEKARRGISGAGISFSGGSVGVLFRCTREEG